MKRILLILLVLSMLFSFAACEAEEKKEDVTPTNFVKFTMQDGSTFVVELYPQYAPQTVANFQKLVGEGFYNGLTFHRIYKGFMLQGGDPNGNGTGKAESGTIPGEFSSNGFKQNTLKHERGVISMARSSAPNSASCQFFIMHADNSNLDGNYAAFGRVVSGMATIDALACTEVTYQNGEKSKPLDPPVIQSAVFVDAESVVYDEEKKEEPKQETEEVVSGGFVKFQMQDGGSFIVELYTNYAPQTVANFKKLVEEGFYNGLTFHRIYKNFMIQGGDPNGNGSGDAPGGTIPGEFAANGFTQNTLSHTRGVISMARADDPNSASCQFFIMHADASYLDGYYAAFGRVVSGMDVVDALANLPVTENPSMGGELSKPVAAPVIESATYSTVMPK